MTNCCCYINNFTTTTEPPLDPVLLDCVVLILFSSNSAERAPYIRQARWRLFELALFVSLELRRRRREQAEGQKPAAYPPKSALFRPKKRKNARSTVKFSAALSNQPNSPNKLDLAARARAVAPSTPVAKVPAIAGARLARPL